jgi:hypothetical protein
MQIKSLRDFMKCGFAAYSPKIAGREHRRKPVFELQSGIFENTGPYSDMVLPVNEFPCV